jgi:glycosyltransferase involved in cell wall biosynthesis
MHIGIDASRISVTHRTGTERYSYELLAALAQIDRSNNYTLYCNGLPAVLPPLRPNFRLRVIPAPRLWTHTRLALEMRQHPPDVLFVPSHVLPLLRPPQSVVTIHDLGYLAFPAAHTPARRLELHLTTLWSALAARRIIAISQATRADLVQRYAITPDKISVVHHGLSPRFQPVTDRAVIAAACERYHIGRIGNISVPYLLYVGTIQPRKNLTRLIDAFAQVVQAGTIGVLRPLQLVIAGKRGWLMEQIEQRAAQHGIGERVRFTGYVDDDDLPALLSGALAFVFPSLYEGFGMPVLEAMACGTPVLTAATSSLPEVAGDAALLVDPRDRRAIADALMRLVDDAALRERLRSRGLEQAARFTWERCAVETLRVLSCQE